MAKSASNVSNTSQNSITLNDLNTIMASQDIIPLLTKDEIQQQLLACHTIQSTHSKLVEEFLNALFSYRPHRNILLEFIAKESKMLGLNFKIVRLWMQSAEYIKDVKKEYLRLFFDILRKNKYLPERFEPGDKGCAEVILCNWVLDELNKAEPDQRSLSYLAYATFLLGAVLKIPRKTLTMDMMPAIKKFAINNYKSGVCTKDGAFDNRKMPVQELFSALYKNPDITETPNFIKALFLIKYANLEVLPRVLYKMQDVLTLKGFETELKHYYSYLTNSFIPVLFSIVHVLRKQEPKKSHATISQLSKFIMEFPVSCLAEVERYIHNLTRDCLNNNRLSLKELLEIIKLNAYVEIKYKKKFLFDFEKLTLLNRIVARKDELDLIDIEMLMHARYTVFENLKDKLSVFDVDFSNIIAKKTTEFSKQKLHFHEMEVYKHLRTKLPNKLKANLKHNFICRDTGKEIDIVYIKDDVKIAIHIEGQKFHYYLDRMEYNRTTLIRNQALQSAGWINICQIVPEKYNELGLETIKNQIWTSLYLILGMCGLLQTKGNSNSLFAMKLFSDMDESKIAHLLKLNLTDIDSFINANIKKRFMNIVKELNLVNSTFKCGISGVIAGYELPHPNSQEFKSIVKGAEKIASAITPLIYPYSKLLFMKEFMNKPTLPASTRQAKANLTKSNMVKKFKI